MANLAKIQPFTPLPDEAPPSIWAPTDGAMAGSAPDIGASNPKTRLPTIGEQNLLQDQARLQKVRMQEARPWGFAGAEPSAEFPEGLAPNHNTKLGKIAHAFSVLGNVAGNTLVPGLMANIPGSQMNMQMEEGGLARRIGKEQTAETENQEREALTNKANTETGLEPGKAASLEAEQGAQTENLRSETAQRGTDLAHAYAHAVLTNQPPEVIQHIADAMKEIQKQPAEGKLSYQTAIDPKTGKPHVYGLDAQGNKVQDVGEHYERPISINTGNAEVDRIAARLGKPYEKGVSDASSQLDKIADARAMINGPAEAQALGIPKVLTALVSGQGSGVRITQPELNAIATARGLGGNIEGTLNSWAGKGKLTSTQQHQLTQLLDDVHARILQKQAIHSEALDKINGAASHADVVAADREARQKLNELSQHGGGQQPQRPANVPEGYQFNQNGPKGAGWYAPTK